MASAPASKAGAPAGRIPLAMRELSDTDPAAAAVLTRLARALPPGRKLEIALAMTQTLFDAARSGVRLRHPGVSVVEARRRLAEVVLPPDLFRAAFSARLGPSCAEEH